MLELGQNIVLVKVFMDALEMICSRVLQRTHMRDTARNFQHSDSTHVHMKYHYSITFFEMHAHKRYPLITQEVF